MANPLKGEVSFEIEGEAYTASFSINALCELEEALGVSVSAIGTMLSGDVKLTTLRLVFWAALLDHHDVTLQAAGELMTALGITKAGAVVGQAFVGAFPAEDAKAPARPQKAAAKAGNG